MKKGPSFSEMMMPSNAQGGTPEYIDETSKYVHDNFYPNRGQEAPAYMASNPRYWEYR